MEVKVNNNFFDIDDIVKIKSFCEEVQDHADRHSKDCWDERLTLGRGNVNIYNIVDGLDDEIHDIIFDKMVEEFELEPNGIMFHFWQPESFITWHDDSGHKGAATVYLNERWDTNDGGLFLYRMDDQITALEPNFNRCVFQTGGVLHCTTATHWKSPVRKSIQVFF